MDKYVLTKLNVLISSKIKYNNNMHFVTNTDQSISSWIFVENCQIINSMLSWN